MKDERENTLVDRIHNLEKDMKDMKSVQPISRESILNYFTYTGNPYDYYMYIDENAPVRYYRVTFNHENAKNKALLHLTIYSSVDNTNVMSAIIPYKSATAPPISVAWKKDLPLQGDKTSWTVKIIKNLPGFFSFNSYFKFYISGTDGGSWTVTPL